MEIVSWVQAHWEELSAAMAAFVALASIVVRLTPTPRDDEALAKIIGLLGLFSILKPKSAKAGLLKMPLTPVKK